MTRQFGCLSARHSHWFGIVFAIVVMATMSSPAWALITGGEGNDPVHDPGWPTGASVVFNTGSRVAYWEGPPLGGGQSHSECRGDTAAFQRVLNDFAKIDLIKKRIILHDGIGKSVWLNAVSDPQKTEAAKIDWVFVVWQSHHLARLLQSPFMARRMGNADDLLLARIDVFTGGSIRWDDIKVPEGIDVDDRRLEAHGFQISDGTVVQGKLTDASSGQPLRGKMILEKIEPQEKGGYAYRKIIEVETNDAGDWVLKNIPPEWCRLVLTADGYASRVIGHRKFDEQPGWSESNFGLVKTGTLSGRVVDHQGKPLEAVDVRMEVLNLVASTGYEIPGEAQVLTDDQGRFELRGLPVGTGRVWLHKEGYVRPGLGPEVEVPSSDAKFVMVQSARLHVTVDFSATNRPADYLVHCEPEGGEQVGKWSGDGSIGSTNEITYENIPPGRYVVNGRPNPGSLNQQTKAILIELKGGETAEVTIKAK